MVHTDRPLNLDWLDDDVRTLPRDLTEFEFWSPDVYLNDMSACFLTPACFEHLPRPLKWLRLVYLESSVSGEDVLNPLYPAYFYCHLPRSLTNLDFRIRFPGHVYSDLEFSSLQGMPVGVKEGLSLLRCIPLLLMPPLNCLTWNRLALAMVQVDTSLM